MTTAGSTVSVREPEVAVPPCESVIFAVNVYGPDASDCEIVPVIVPVAPRVRPPGRLPEFNAQVKGPTPPVCARVDVYAAPTPPTGVKVPEVLTVTAPLMVMLKFAV